MWYFYNWDTASLQTLHLQVQSALQIHAPCISQSHEYSGSPVSASHPHA